MSHPLARMIIMSIACVPFLTACGTSNNESSYSINSKSSGTIEKIDNISNLSVVSVDDNVYKAEYEAGFIQGRLQKEQILATRDNVWDSYYLTDDTPTFVKSIPPSADEIAAVQAVLTTNYNYTLQYLANLSDATIRTNLQRLFYRLVGIYHGTKLNAPEDLTFDETVFPAAETFVGAEMTLGYGTDTLTFLDIYFINGSMDVMDVLDNDHLTRCSAFVKKVDGDIFITHNSWMSYLDQSVVGSFYINGDYFTANFAYPGLIGSDTDFGYNNKGILFNETTHHYTYTEGSAEKLWMFWRSALAEQFASSMDEFYNYLSLEASGTYMNGYMIVDANTNEIGLVEMSYRSFVYFKPNGSGGYTVTTKPEGQSQAYDTEMVTENYIIGVNYPASTLIREELQAVDTRPARKRQFLAMIGDVTDIDSAMDLITYTDPENPLSIFGRWDLGEGETPTPHRVPDGSADAKAASASMIAYTSSLSGTLDRSSTNKSFWMKFGSPYVNDKPFIWSESEWSSQTLRDVPDRIDGDFNLMNAYIK